MTTAYGQLRKTTITKCFFYGLSCSLKVLFVEKLQEGRVTIEEAAEDDRRYSEYLRNEGRNDIWAYGIAFFKKLCKVVAEKLK